MTAEKPAFHTSIWWKCDSCGTTFSPGSEQCGVYSSTLRKLCVPCIGKIDAKINEINNMKDTPMKPFNASEFISNQETPVISRHKQPVEIVTTKGRGAMSVVGYVGSDTLLRAWSCDGCYISSVTHDYDLFFAPKLEVVHVYQYRDDPKGRYALLQDGGKLCGNANAYTYLGTITGPIVPPERESGVEK